MFLQIRQQIRNEMLEEIKNKPSSDELFIIKEKKHCRRKDKINWKEDNEFEFNGKMYDVAWKTETADSVTYYCLNDEKEEALLANFIKFNESCTNGKFSSGRSMTNLPSLSLFIPVNKCKINLSAFYYDNMKETDKNHYKSLSRKIPTPPPETLI